MAVTSMKEWYQIFSALSCQFRQKIRMAVPRRKTGSVTERQPKCGREERAMFPSYSGCYSWIHLGGNNLKNATWFFKRQPAYVDEV